MKCFFYSKWFLLMAVGIGMFCVFTNSYAQAVNESNTSITPTESHLSIKDKAALWGLNERDYIRYTDIIQGPIQYWNPTIDPVLVLGIFAETESEKNRFAELYARQEYALVTKTQEFERLYHDAFRRMYPNAQMISSELMAPYHQNTQKKKKTTKYDFSTNKLLDNDRIVFFLRRDCDTCATMIHHLHGLTRRHKKLFIDFFILDANNENDARAWARENLIPTDLVQLGKVTINIDDGDFDRIKSASKQDTDVFLHRGDNMYAITKNELLLQ